MALTGGKQKFADAVLAGKSNKDAAITAGYSVKTASAAGSRLVKDKDVVAYVARCKKAKKDQAKEPQKDIPTSNGFDLLKLQFSDPKAFLKAAMNDLLLEPKLRVEAAKALMPFEHKKLGEGGKKEQQAEAAQKVAGRFAASAPPKLVAAGGKKV
ncbi:MAG TPA: terminase small subunit [Noviherbaspirillum sp.]|nr:terminase small subunit [Noviherbaspirillum sp.]